MRARSRRWAWVVLLWCLAPMVVHAETLAPIGHGAVSASPDAIDQLLRAGQSAKARSSGHQLDDTLIVPMRSGHNNVRYYDFDWRYYDYLDDRGVGGVRFYFYQRELNVARIAAALVREQYEMLAKKFNYRPTTRIPYILYNSHREFENTNVFFVNEYILGVTSPQDLRMALPYWGEIERFREVSTHEMTHQFQIQKMKERAEAAGQDSAIDKLPLWFTEGLAEYYSKNGIDLETDMFARDILLNPRPDKGYGLPSFWDDGKASYIYTYKLGQLRVAFLAEQYGERILQAIIDQSPMLAAPPAGGFGFSSDSDKEGFPAYVARLAGEKPSAIAERFTDWMRRRYYPEYLQSSQEPPAIAPLELEGEPDAFSSNADGNIILYRTVERDSGRSHLYLADRRDRSSAVQVAVDGVPGLESLYPVLRRVTAIGTDKLAFLARSGPSDSLFIVPFQRVSTDRGRRFRFTLGERRVYDLFHAGLVEAGDPAFSPSEDRVAFFGLNNEGYIDIWTTKLATGEVKRITDDLYSERDLAWTNESPAVYGVPIRPGGGNDGTIIVASDETEHRKYNLFAVDPATGERVRLTDEPADHRGPVPLGNGEIVFSSDARGKQDLHVYDAKTKRIKRITDFLTGLSAPGIGPHGLMAVGVYGGQYRIFDVPTSSFLSLDERPALEGERLPPAPLPREYVPADAPHYYPYTAENWRLQNAIAAVGTYSYGQGALLFGDTLADRNVLVQFSVLGSWSLTDALAFYMNRAARQQYGFGIFHTFEQRRDVNAPGFNPPGTSGEDVYYLQREFGATELWSYPFNPFSRVEARFVQQGVERSFMFPINPDNSIPQAFNTEGLQQWNTARSGYDFDTYLSLRLGFDATRYHFPGGAIGGGSALIEGGVGTLPFHQPNFQAYGYGLFDAQYHLKVWSLGALHLRLAGGDAFGSVFGRQFWLISYDNLRNYQAFDRRLIGTSYLVTNANFEVPLDSLIQLAIFSNIFGVIGADFGSVANNIPDLWPTRTLCGVLGVNLGLGPIELRVQFAKPINTGNNNNNMPYGWVTNISLQYLYF